MVAVLAILYVWYVTRGLNSVTDTAVLSLETEEDKLLLHWYKANIRPAYDFNVNDIEIAAKYLHRVHGLDINPNLLVVGTNLDHQYYNHTRNLLSRKYVSGTDCLFDIRSNLAKNGEIAVIHNTKVRSVLQRDNSIDLTEVNIIMNNDLDVMARDYIQDVLKVRWDQINALDDPNVANYEGSYVYLRVETNNRSGNPITVFDTVTAMMTPSGARINLLCTNYEFEALIRRWKQCLSKSIRQLPHTAS